jgi:ribose transport system permease protein
MAMPLALIAGLFASLLVSTCIGLLVTRVGVNSFITTLGMTSLLTGILYGLTGGYAIDVPNPKALMSLATRTLFDMPYSVYYTVVIAIIAWYVLEQTPFGRYLYAIGGSKEGARLAGIDTRRLTFYSFLISGLLAGIAGIITASKLAGGQPTVGPGYLLPSFTACFLSAAAFKPGVYNVAGVVLAIILLSTGVTGLQMVGVPWWIEYIFNGAALIASLAIIRYLRGEAV